MPFQVDTLLLKGFIAAAETGSFTQAAARVGRTQSAISLQIKKLEESLGASLFSRDKGRVALTEAGEVFLSYARRIIDMQWEAYSALKEPEAEGEIRLGTPEDFATQYLPGVLTTFRQHHPRVQLSVDCDLTLNLAKKFEQGKLDLALVKRDPQLMRGGTRVWREPLVWAASARYRPDKELALVLSPAPCIYRARALAALDRARRPWRVTYTSPSLSGTVAAVQAGLGVTVLPENMLPDGVSSARRRLKLPELADAEIALLKKDVRHPAVKIMADHIISALGDKNILT